MTNEMQAHPWGRAFFMCWGMTAVVCLGVVYSPGLSAAESPPEMSVEEGERIGEEFGIIVGEVDEAIQKELGLVKAQGVVVFEVIGGTPAELAGIKVRAVIKEIDKYEIRNMHDFGTALKKTMDQCGFTIGTYEPPDPDNQGMGGMINFHLVRCLRD